MLNTGGYERIKRNLRNNRLQTINVMVLKRVLCCFFLQLRISFVILFFRRSVMFHIFHTKWLVVTFSVVPGYVCVCCSCLG